MNIKELADRCREMTFDMEFWEQIIAALERCAELEADAERLDCLEVNDLEVFYDPPGWHLRPAGSALRSVGSGPTIREAIDALRSRESNPTKEP